MALLTDILAKSWSGVLGQVLPSRCGVCHRSGYFLCIDCQTALSPASGLRCGRCWQPYGGGICPRCEEYGAECTAIRACFRHQDGARQLVTAVKYRGQYALVEAMAALMAERWRAERLSADVVAAVPLHHRRERERGFNQSALLASGLAQRLSLPHNRSALRRIRSTAPQVRTRSERERRENVYHAFTCTDDSLQGSRVLLVDDVTTTGATLGACASALFEGGAAAVFGFAFAIAPI